MGTGSAIEYANLVVQAAIFEKLSIFLTEKTFKRARTGITPVAILLELSKFTVSQNLVNTKVSGLLHFHNHLGALYQHKSSHITVKNEGSSMWQ